MHSLTLPGFVQADGCSFEGIIFGTNSTTGLGGRISVQETKIQSVNQWLITLASCKSPDSDARAVIIASYDTKFEIIFSM